GLLGVTAMVPVNVWPTVSEASPDSKKVPRKTCPSHGPPENQGSGPEDRHGGSCSPTAQCHADDILTLQLLQEFRSLHSGHGRPLTPRAGRLAFRTGPILISRFWTLKMLLDLRPLAHVTTISSAARPQGAWANPFQGGIAVRILQRG